MLGFGDGWMANRASAEAVSSAYSFRAYLPASAICCYQVDAGLPIEAHPAIHG
jgi:hypothetical protein